MPFHMVPPWVGHGIWKFWETGILVFIVFAFFSVFSPELLPSPCKNTESGSLSSSVDFLHDFTLSVIDMHQNSSLSTLLPPFDHFQKLVFGRLILWHLLRCRLTSFISVTIGISSALRLCTSFMCSWIDGTVELIGHGSRQMENAHLALSAKI